ncbi:MAG TPA: ATP-binding protein [Patescibacteria group bacterium]|nr:ATP-binding protein [Patescibacteria group bacterium]
MFENARLKLTAYYLAIIMLVSIFFSSAIYLSVTNEFRRFERIQIRAEQDFKDGVIVPPPSNTKNFAFRIGKPDPEFINAARARILLTLGFINLGIFGLAGAAGYFLAGRTLRPIKKMVDEQNRFITDASHELRTPLTSLRTEMEVALREKSLSDKDSKQIIKSNLEEVVSLQELSDHLIELAQNGKYVNKDNFQEVLLPAVINAAVKKVSPQAKNKKISITQKITDAKVNGVYDRLVEVFVILLDNAIKYSSTGSKINLTSKDIKDNVEISVTDQGVGIDQEDIPHIFDRFYRSDKSRSKTSGFGLGLSIAKKIVSSHGGSLEVESELGKGTKFTVSLSELS